MEKVMKRRWMYLFVGFILLCFFGVIYAWSMFIEPMEAEFGWQRSQTSAIFSISCITVNIGMVISGSLESRIDHRKIFVGAAALIVAGFLGAAFCQSLMQIFFFYGVLVGTGVGIGFNSAINIPMKWFPDKIGVGTGCLLMGYGAGAMILSPLVTTLLGMMNWRFTFVVLAILFGVIVVCGALILRVPDPEQVAPLIAKAKETNSVSRVDLTPQQALKKPVFWIAFVWLMLVCSGGLGLISQAVPAAQEVLGTSEAAVALATAAMGSVSLCNGLGRLLNGFIWDRFGYRASLIWISVAFSLGMLACAFGNSTGNFPLLVAGFVLLGLMYGGNMSATSTIAGTFFGTKHFAINYAVLCCQMIPAAVIGPTLLAAMQTGSGSYLSAFWAFFAIAVFCFLFQFLVRRPNLEEEASEKMNLAEMLEDSAEGMA